MSRFLKKRHYHLIVPGVYYFRWFCYGSNPDVPPIEESISDYLNKTGVSYTMQDVAEIQSHYLRKYAGERV